MLPSNVKHLVNLELLNFKKKISSYIPMELGLLTHLEHIASFAYKGIEKRRDSNWAW